MYPSQSPVVCEPMMRRHPVRPVPVRIMFLCLGAIGTANARHLQPLADAFAPGAPAIVESLPDEWGGSGIDEEQVFLLRLKAPATEKSVEEHAYCSFTVWADHVPDDVHVPVEVLKGDARQAILDQFDEKDQTVEVLKCRAHLPNQRSMTVHWGAGITSVAGVALPAEQTLQFDVRFAFTIRIECAAAYATGGCVPDRPLGVGFSSPVPRAQALAIRLRTPDGREHRPSSPAGPDAPVVQSVEFPGPFPRNSELTIDLPSGIHDDSGRAPANLEKFPWKVHVGMSPTFRIPSFVVLESSHGGILPYSAQAIESSGESEESQQYLRLLRIPWDAPQVQLWMERLRWSAAGSSRASIFRAEDPQIVPLPAPKNPEQAEESGIALGRPGLYVAEIASQFPNEGAVRVSTVHESVMILVTNLAVHVKSWAGSALIWVTRLDNGMPVANAHVAMQDTCSGTQYWQGVTDAQGIVIATPIPTLSLTRTECLFGAYTHAFVATSGDDTSFVLSNWGIIDNAFWINLPSLDYDFDKHLPEGRKLDRRVPRLGPSPAAPELREVTAQVPPAAVRLGIRQELGKDSNTWRTRVLAVDREGRPQSRQHVRLGLYGLLQTVQTDHGLGGFEFVHYEYEWMMLGPTCSGVTNLSGTLVCDWPAMENSGLPAVQAQSQDGQGHIAHAAMMIMGVNNMWSFEPSKVSVPLEPPVYAYAPQDLARFKIGVSLENATALVTVEDGKLLSRFVTRLPKGVSLIEVPLSAASKPSDLVSVLVSGTPPAVRASGSNEMSEPRVHLASACISVPEPADVEMVDGYVVPRNRSNTCYRNVGQTATMLGFVVTAGPLDHITRIPPPNTQATSAQ
jgi:hypothetical protein